jgi:ribonuclease T2
MRVLRFFVLAALAVLAVRAPLALAADTKAPEYILSLSWEPAFCQTHTTKPECAGETATSIDATHFSLHGLWPQPFKNQYCNVDAATIDRDKHHDWKSLPAVDLAPALRTRIAAAMPGTRSLLERHEWLRHGTCYGADQNTYFGDALALVDAVNSSPVAALFADNVGKQVTSTAIRDAFDKAFGAGAGERVKVSCVGKDDQRAISEITVGLVGKPGGGHGLAELVAGSKPTSPGCPAGLVAAVGAH